jgi:hypothetical protein
MNFKLVDKHLPAVAQTLIGWHVCFSFSVFHILKQIYRAKGKAAMLTRIVIKGKPHCFKCPIRPIRIAFFGIAVAPSSRE